MLLDLDFISSHFSILLYFQLQKLEATNVQMPQFIVLMLKHKKMSSLIATKEHTLPMTDMNIEILRNLM